MPDTLDVVHVSLFPPGTTEVKAGGISVNILVKNCAQSLKECLQSLTDFLDLDAGDEVVVVDTGSTDETPRVAEQYGARVFHHAELSDSDMTELLKKHTPDLYEKWKDDPQLKGGFIRDFSAARAIAVEHSKNGLIFWLDSDDVLEGGKQLRRIADDEFKKPDQQLLMLRYDYAFDQDGACITTLWRERIIRKDSHEWRGFCHESMVPKNGAVLAGVKVLNSEISVVHKGARHHEISDIRNYAIMLDAYEKADWKDPRLELYLGHACRGLRRWKESIHWHGLALLRSGSRDDRYTAALDIATALIILGRPWRAMDTCFQAIKVLPQDPRAYFTIAKCYYELKKWEECLLWTGIARNFPEPQSYLAIDPTGLTFYPTVYEAMSLKNMGRGGEAVAVAKQALMLRPNFPAAKELFREVKDWAEDEQMRASLRTCMYMAFSDKAAHEMVLRMRPELRRRIREFQIETSAVSEKCVTFFCPGGAKEPWDATSFESGIGGSETMVIELAKRFAKKGWTAEVYGNPKEENLYKTLDGVIYRPYQAFNPHLKRDILVFWRTPCYVDIGVKARKIFVDMHDVAAPQDFTDLRMKRIAGVFWKSKFHRGTAKACPEEKCIYTRNGIDHERFKETVVRNPRKIIWTSSADRGLQGALAGWELIQREFPDAEFHVFYGFTDMYREVAALKEYEHMGDFGCDRHMLDYMEETLSLMEILKVHFHGRVGRKELTRHLLESNVWLYPTRFPEISCISAMEAQAAGAFPVCSNYAALAETVTWGTMVKHNRPEEMAGAVRHFFNGSGTEEIEKYRAEMREHARQAFNLDTLADDWEREFLR